MGPEVPLRIAGPGDVAPVTRLVGGFRDFLGGSSPSNAEIEATAGILLRDRSTEFLLIGEPETGFAQIRFRLSVWNAAEDAWLEDLFVEEVARGEGYGRMLVEAAIERARSRGCDRIQLDVNAANESALSLYESVGFVPRHNEAKWGESPDYFMTCVIRS
ncbi:MAG: GNAT family N-acetyltransferase [Solirubrobacterales bacterium]|nr:GNAT family N-acetyltransferase [Solirubrobacterales bacterium]HMT04325.1 GNAT family N-acetyltransferase [Solirubrobacterales bacterium]